MRVLGIGDNVCDIYLHTRTMYPGGQALNVAVNAARLGANAAYLGAFGSDPIADHVAYALDMEGVDRSRCRVYKGENGYARVTLKAGDRVFLGSNKGGVLRDHPLLLDEDDLEYCRQFHVIHTSNNSYFDKQLASLTTLPALISYDFSNRWNEEDRVNRVCPHADVAFCSGSGLSVEEARELAGRLLAKGCRLVCATRGAEAAYACDGVNEWLQPPDPDDPVDTMGAGDSFAACVLVHIGRALEREGRPAWTDCDFRARILPQALQAAADWSANTCRVRGAFGYGTEVPEPIWVEIEKP
jgi:fructoselysine 6-kinase